MLKLYQTSSSTATRQAKDSLDSWGLDYIVQRLDNLIFTKAEFYKILSCLDGGVNTILSDRSGTYRKVVIENNIDIDSLKLSELYELIKTNPSMLKSPITVDYENSRVVIGSDADKLFQFNPKEVKRQKRESYRNETDDFFYSKNVNIPRV